MVRSCGFGNGNRLWHGFRLLGLDECRIAAADDNLAIRGLIENRFGLEGERIEKDQFENEWIWTLGREDWADGEERKGKDEEDKKKDGGYALVIP